MAMQFVTDDSELTDEYKEMMDAMLQQIENGTAMYVSADYIENKFIPE
ncbi:hypothetical protein [Mucilaginibacter sp.]|nr:hypothetical protein [Mucilaginibacter sp.]